MVPPTKGRIHLKFRDLVFANRTRFKGDVLENLLTDKDRYTLILYSLPTDRHSVDLVRSYAQRHRVPLITIHSAGFHSYFRVQLPGTFPIVDTHPDSTATTDLRLLQPWSELSEFAKNLTKDIDHLPDHEHGHIPYIALLLHFLAQWKEKHGFLPSTYKEKTAFRGTIAAGARTDNAEGGEENFDEAVAAVLKTITLPRVPSSVKEVFDYQPNEVRIQFVCDIGLLLMSR